MNDFHDGGETIGCTRRRCNDVLRVRIIVMIVHAIDDICRIAVFNRGGDDDLFNASSKIWRELGFGFKRARAINDHIDAFERQFVEIACFAKRKLCAINRYAVIVVGEVCVPSAMHSVKFQQMRVHFWIAYCVIEKRDFSTTFEQRAQR